jgi:vitamin B12 transport system substrate-binding protein
VLEICGGQNIFADSRVAWPQVSREQVLMRQPQVIVAAGDEVRFRKFSTTGQVSSQSRYSP